MYPGRLPPLEGEGWGEVVKAISIYYNSLNMHFLYVTCS